MSHKIQRLSAQILTRFLLFCGPVLAQVNIESVIHSANKACFRATSRDLGQMLSSFFIK